MSRRVNPDAVSTARLLLVEYYTSGRRRHTFDSIAKRAHVSRSTVARLAREVRVALPTVAQLLDRIEALEHRLSELEASQHVVELLQRRKRWAS